MVRFLGLTVSGWFAKRSWRIITEGTVGGVYLGNHVNLLCHWFCRCSDMLYFLDLPILQHHDTHWDDILPRDYIEPPLLTGTRGLPVQDMLLMALVTSTMSSFLRIWAPMACAVLPRIFPIISFIKPQQMRRATRSVSSCVHSCSP